MDTRIAEDGDTVLVLNSGYAPCDTEAWAIPGTVGVLRKSRGSLFRVEGFRGDLRRSEFKLLPKNHKKKETTMPKTSTAKNLNKTFAKPKPKSTIEKAVAKLHKELQAVPKAPLLEVPEAFRLEKTSTKAQLAAQVVELTKNLNASEIAVEKLKLANVRSIHNEKLALSQVKDLKKKAKA